MDTHFRKLTEPNPSILEAFNRWENDSELIPLTRPNQNEKELNRRDNVTLDNLRKRMKHQNIYLIYLNDLLAGEMNYMVDPGHLYKKVPGTAWIGITIGEPVGRGQGIGMKAMNFLEQEIKKQGIKRIELGVFEFNNQAYRLYQKLGYKDIGHIDDFTYWQGRMWADIRMEKYL
ncbi:GNAT family N-acetyltransferase [Virgibacillus doumboii]|uniref:GNAT family N-acetyltransferase n=1 Tax=Virgibacillus doumboii TaxID=2697503 RepID=UPI0013DE9EF9|nr:GNAT family N-acetyltransferase [Virgibacillus doumboii]